MRKKKGKMNQLPYLIYREVILYMNVSIWSIDIPGSWGYLTGSWREATPHLIVFLRNISEN